MENQLPNVRFFIKKQITKPFLEQMFMLANSKSLRRRSTVFEMYPCHGVWDSTFKLPLLSVLKLFIVCSEKVCLIFS